VNLDLAVNLLLVVVWVETVELVVAAISKMDLLETLVNLEVQALLEHQEIQELVLVEDNLVMRVELAQMVMQVLQVILVLMGLVRLQVKQVLQVNQEILAQLEILAQQEILVLLELVQLQVKQDSVVNQVMMEQMELLEIKVNQAALLQIKI
jgi:hypothetical protein